MSQNRPAASRAFFGGSKCPTEIAIKGFALPLSGTLLSCLLKNAIVAFFNLAKLGAKLLAARKITTYVVILSLLPCDAPAC